MRRTSCHVLALISTISLEALHATKTEAPSVEGSAQVGEQEWSPGLGGSEPCPLMPGIACVAVVACSAGEPIIPVSLFFVTMKWRVALKERVSISTSVSSIMQAEYCFVPCGLRREPCGIVQVVTRATSVMVCVETTDTDEGTMSPCKLKFTTKRKLPSGVMSIVAGKFPSVVLPRTASSFVEYFQTVPNGRPWAMET